MSSRGCRTWYVETCHNPGVRVVLISTYELGRQPFGLASPAAWLREAGIDVRCLDLSREKFSPHDVLDADFVAFYLPMHTATRLAVPIVERVRASRPRIRICCYGLYAPLNEALLRSLGVDYVLGGEFEEALLRIVTLSNTGPSDGPSAVPRIQFRVPDRRDLPPLDGYAMLQVGDTRRTCGYTEASRGCKHFCRHCPVVPVYEGRFRVVPVDVVEADIRGQVEAGAEHITFGDPDFFNGIRHAMAVVAMVGREFPGVTYDVTIKIEHLLEHQRALSRLEETGCLFVTSAVESLDDEVLRKLQKGHTRADFERALGCCRGAGLTLVPTFIPFMPWMSLDGYGALLRAIDELDLIDAVAPIQLAIRLLVPAGSHLLELADLQSVLEPFDRARLCYPWRHPEAQVDALYAEVSDLVGRCVDRPRREMFARIVEVALDHGALDAPVRSTALLADRATVPYLNEPWYC